ncbi:MAG: ACT domain-containing protein [Clostridia bacterium]
MRKALVSVMGVDKPGIIAKVSTALFELNINVLEISQTILDGYFTMLMIVDTTNATATFAEVADCMNAVGETLGETVNIQRADIFDAMHRI